MFYELGFQNLINQSTHQDGNILDLLLTNQPGLISNITVTLDLVCPSDHYSIKFRIRKNVRRKYVKKCKVFKYSEADWEGMAKELESYEWFILFNGLSC